MAAEFQDRLRRLGNRPPLQGRRGRGVSPTPRTVGACATCGAMRVMPVTPVSIPLVPMLDEWTPIVTCTPPARPSSLMTPLPESPGTARLPDDLRALGLELMEDLGSSGLRERYVAGRTASCSEEPGTSPRARVAAT